MTLFKNIFDNIRRVDINIDWISKDVLFEIEDGSVYGGLLYKSVYFDASDEIKWDIFPKLYKSLDSIHILNTMKLSNNDNRYAFWKSILITDSFISNMLSFLSCSRTVWIGIYYPRNTNSELESFISKYSTSFDRIGFEMKMGNTSDTQHGTCVRLCVSPK